MSGCMRQGSWSGVKMHALGIPHHATGIDKAMAMQEGCLCQDGHIVGAVKSGSFCVSLHETESILQQIYHPTPEQAEGCCVGCEYHQATRLRSDTSLSPCMPAASHISRGGARTLSHLEMAITQAGLSFNVWVIFGLASCWLK